MVNQQKIVLSAMGHFHPVNDISNSFFEELDIDSDSNWIEDRTGIQSRRSVLELSDIIALQKGAKNLDQLREEGRIASIADMSEQAWKSLSSRNFESTQDIDLVVCGTSVPDYDIPANGCTIAGRLNINCPSFDINSACSSFIADTHFVRGVLGMGMHKKAAVFNPERYTVRLDYHDRTSCVLFGDGCIAGVYDATGHAKSGLELIDTMVEGEPFKYEVVQMPDGKYFHQNGKAVQKFAVTRTVEITRQILEKNGFSVSDLSYFIAHQGNYRMLISGLAKLGLDENKHLHNVKKFGNQGAAGAPAVLSINWDKYQSGDLIVVSVVGSGLTWGSALFRKL